MKFKAKVGHMNGGCTWFEEFDEPGIKDVEKANEFAVQTVGRLNDTYSQLRVVDANEEFLYVTLPVEEVQ
jgi:hypothetical protein